jgi:hypothetical protein
MKYQARVVRLNEDIEEEVVVVVGQHELTCFANVCPYHIKAGDTYSVSLSLWAVDGLELCVTTGEKAIARIGSGFKYGVTGVLHKAMLDAGIQFVDDLFAQEYAYLSGSTVFVEVDRIEVAFEGTGPSRDPSQGTRPRNRPENDH